MYMCVWYLCVYGCACMCESIMWYVCVCMMYVCVFICMYMYELGVVYVHVCVYMHVCICTWGGVIRSRPIPPLFYSMRHCLSRKSLAPLPIQLVLGIPGSEFQGWNYWC